MCIRDRNEAHAGFLLQFFQQVHDLRLHCDVQRCGRFVRDQHRWVQGDRHRDHDALAHPAGELVRERARPLLGCGDANAFHQRDRLRLRIGAVQASMNAEHLGDLPADLEHRVEGAQRVLEDHRDARPAHQLAFLLGQLELVDPAESYLPAGHEARRAVEDPHDRLRGHGLP